tara:strand:+ start:1917 stop:2318 length:402 start_codon:yes stop_codon:yes gene_type:complete
MAKDRRYKVDRQMIMSMRRMRATGASYRAIGEAHGVSGATALYWIDDSQRAKQRAKNAKRTYSPGDKQRISRDMQKRRDNWKDEPDMRLRHTIQSAKDEKRSTRRTVKGMKMDEAKRLLKSGKLKKDNNKIGE